MEFKRFSSKQLSSTVLPADAPDGSVVAEISVFNTIDHSKDVVLPTFFADGQELLMEPWGHEWGELNPGKGVVHVQPNAAVFDAQFYLDTPNGVATYNTVKRNGHLQEWSFAFNILEHEYGSLNGEKVRYLKRGEIFGGAPVFKGDNSRTRTLDIKGLHKGIYVSEPPEGSYQDQAEDIAEAATAQGLVPPTACVATIAHFPGGYAYLSVWDWQNGDGETDYYRVEYTLNETGDPVLANPTEVEPGVVFSPIEQPGLSFAGQTERVLAAVRGLTTRSKALAAVRFKEGRVLSAANHDRLSAVADGIDAHIAEMREVLENAKPAVSPKSAQPAQRELARFLADQARLNGVAIGA